MAPLHRTGPLLRRRLDREHSEDHAAELLLLSNCACLFFICIAGRKPVHTCPSHGILSQFCAWEGRLNNAGSLARPNVSATSFLGHELYEVIFLFLLYLLFTFVHVLLDKLRNLAKCAAILLFCLHLLQTHLFNFWIFWCHLLVSLIHHLLLYIGLCTTRHLWCI